MIMIMTDRPATAAGRAAGPILILFALIPPHCHDGQGGA